MTNPNEQAFPRPHLGERGLTKREHYAGLAMQGFCAHPVIDEDAEPDEIAVMAIEQADALIEALNKGGE